MTPSQIPGGHGAVSAREYSVVIPISSRTRGPAGAFRSADGPLKHLDEQGVEGVQWSERHEGGEPPAPARIQAPDRGASREWGQDHQKAVGYSGWGTT